MEILTNLACHYTYFLYQQSKGTILINITRTELYTSSSCTYLLMLQKSKYRLAEIIKWVKVEGLEQPFFDTNYKENL